MADDNKSSDDERRARFDAARLRYERAAGAMAAAPGVVDLDMLADDGMVIVESRLEHIGIVETRHMAETGESPSPAFDEAARAAARAAGFSDEEIDDLFTPMPISLDTYDLQRDPDESDDDYAFRRSLFEKKDT
jgi:hypothetical protein